MTTKRTIFRGGLIYDGTSLLEGHVLICLNGKVSEIVPEKHTQPGEIVVDLDGDTLSAGYVDLQVNGGGGVLFNDDPSVATLRTIAASHRSLGAVRVLPTLISADRAKTAAAIEAAIEAQSMGLSGVAGLHLEGPHLSIARKGAHDPAAIRPMEADDITALIRASQSLSVLKVTVAPESVSCDQVRSLAKAGVVVSLGHTDADYETCLRYAAAGACCATHLFNAMSQLGNRSPGLVGAVLASETLSAGVIADGIHVHPEALRVAWAAKRGPGQLYLVSDAMAVAGSQILEFVLDGRRVIRHHGKLTLQDGTLAGADLDLSTAIRVAIYQVGIDPASAFAAATKYPGTIIGLMDWHLRQGFCVSDIIRVSKSFDTVSTLSDSLH